MPEEPQQDAAQQGLEFAHRLARLGAAASRGGVYGVANEALRQNKAWLVGVLVVLFLPVVLLLMLPSVIFGSLSDHHDTPILNDNAHVAQNIVTATQSIRTILWDSYLAARQEIDTAAAALPYVEIEDDYGGGISLHATRLLSMYCAAQGSLDYTQISLEDLNQQVLAQQGNFFDYDTDTETRTEWVERTTTVTVDGVEVEQTEQVQEQHEYTIFTVQYHGGEIFGTTLWPLTEAEQALANDYAANLNILLRELRLEEGSDILSDLSAWIEGNPLTAPVDGFVNPMLDDGWRSHISSRFGLREDVGLPGVDTTDHGGLDLAYPYGTPIHAVQSGQVVRATYGNSYGNHIVLYHGGEFSTLYAHCSELLVQVGDTVQQGDVIARVGSTGDSTGNHLHLECIVNGVRVDPEPYLQ